MPRITAPAIGKLKGERKAVMITAYDATSARLADEAADMILVGDSLGMVVQGRANTLAVTMDEMIYHSRIVAQCSEKAHLMGDMPFLSYQTSPADAVANAGRFLKEGGVQSVKLEGGARSLPAIEAIVRADIPVMGHIGYTPQSEHKVGTGKVNRDADTLLKDAKLLESAGVFSLLLECVPADIAAAITKAVRVPTIGIGAGPGCDGQVLVFHDILGFNPDFKPKFVKQYFDFYGQASKALKSFRDDVVKGAFPGDEHSFK